ncbi:MAG: VWA domain-containing protein [Rickettsiales bacterium]|nr:VWA domain-containing protein [Rickettsiales bacterium]
MFQFENPFVAILFLVPVIVYFLFSSDEKRTGNLPTINNPNLKWFVKSFGNKGSFSAKVGKFNFLLYIIWCLLVIALMQPNFATKISKTKTEGYDILIAVDISKSMSANDLAEKFGQNRLDVVKNVAKEFIIKREGDRIGLIIFGQNAYLQAPLSQDLQAITEMLDLANIGIAGDATAIGDAIALAVKTFSNKPKSSRVLILLTDGANTAGIIDPLEAANIAKNFNIKIHTISVGKSGVIPIKMADGSLIYAKMEVDEDLLNEISRLTGGTSNKATDRIALEKVYKKINEMEKSKSETNEVIIRDELYIYPLALAMIIMLVRILYNYKWRKFLLR